MACTEGDDPTPICNASLSLEVSSLVASPCGTRQGSFSIQVSNGDGNYQSVLDGGETVEYSSFKGLAPGLHTISVEDGNGCVGEMEVLVPSGVTMEEIYPIVQESCAVIGCHDGRTAGRANFRVEGNIRSKATEIRDRIQAGNMPPSNAEQSLSTEAIELLTCWANDQ